MKAIVLQNRSTGNNKPSIGGLFNNNPLSYNWKTKWTHARRDFRHWLGGKTTTTKNDGVHVL